MDSLTGRAMAQSPSTSSQQDIGKRESVAPITSPVEMIPTTISLPSLYDDSAEGQFVPEARSLKVHPGGVIPQSAHKTNEGGPLHREGGTSSYSANETKIQPADASRITPKQLTTTKSEAKSVLTAPTKGQRPLVSSSKQISSEATFMKALSSPDIYQRDTKLYVGRMREVQCPTHVQAEWTGSIRSRLINDLLPVVRTLPRSMDRQQTIIHPELCMAGYAKGKATDVQLVPTVWIRCGSKKCRKVVREAVADLAYLFSISQGRVEVRIRGPWPGATSVRFSLKDELSIRRRQDYKHGDIGIECGIPAIGVPSWGLEKTASGPSMEMPIEDETIDGLIRIDDKMYGITTDIPSSRIASGSRSANAYYSDSEAHSDWCSDPDSDSE